MKVQILRINKKPLAIYFDGTDKELFELLDKLAYE